MVVVVQGTVRLDRTVTTWVLLCRVTHRTIPIPTQVEHHLSLPSMNEPGSTYSLSNDLMSDLCRIKVTNIRCVYGCAHFELNSSIMLLFLFFHRAQHTRPSSFFVIHKGTTSPLHRTSDSHRPRRPPLRHHTQRHCVLVYHSSPFVRHHTLCRAHGPSLIRFVGNDCGWWRTCVCQKPVRRSTSVSSYSGIDLSCVGAAWVRFWTPRYAKQDNERPGTQTIV